MIYLIRSPESQSRPERFIANQIKQHLPECVDLIQSNGIDPLEGKSFYDTPTFVNCFTQSAVKLTEIGLKDGDVLFFVEGFNPILPLIDYYLVCENIKVKKCGIFHSNCHTPGDLFEHSETIHNLERYLLQNSLDVVFAASQYLSDNILKSYAGANVSINGLPCPEIPSIDQEQQREDTVIFSHRWAEDKNKDFFKLLAKHCSNKPYKFKLLTPNVSNIEDLSGFNIEVTHCPDKAMYFNEIQKAKVVFSCATLETYGYSVIEGICSGLVPVVPDYASYHDLINLDYTYAFDPSALTDINYVNAKIEELSMRLDDAIANYTLRSPKDYVSKSFNFNAAAAIAERIKELHNVSTDNI